MRADFQPQDVVMQPWQARHARSPVLQHSLVGTPPVRARPLIYVYDMDTLFTSKMLQWRHVKEACVSRHYDRYVHPHGATLVRLLLHGHGASHSPQQTR